MIMLTTFIKEDDVVDLVLVRARSDKSRLEFPAQVLDGAMRQAEAILVGEMLMIRNFSPMCSPTTGRFASVFCRDRAAVLLDDARPLS